MTTMHDAKAVRRMGTKVYRGVCPCGWVGSNGTRTEATRSADRHNKTAAKTGA